jgi:hypothetical protein
MQLTIEIAKVPFAIELPDGPLALALGNAWRDFRREPRSDARTIHFEADHRPAPSGARAMPTVSSRSITGAGFEAVVSSRSAHVKGALERFGIESVLKLMLATELLEQGGILVHAAGLSNGPSAAVLLGESGAGKSTLGSTRGLLRLADELVALVGDQAHGTPWNVGVSESARLLLLGTLGWASTPRLEPVPPADFLPLLLSNTLLPDDTAATRAAVFQIASGLLKAHPPQRFYFPPDDRAAEFLRAWLSTARRPPPPRAG